MSGDWSLAGKYREYCENLCSTIEKTDAPSKEGLFQYGIFLIISKISKHSIKLP
jgi:hypothetical protein